MRGLNAERDYFSKPTFGGNNNINTRAFDKSREIPRSNKTIYNQPSFSDSSESSDFNLSAILNTGEVFPEDLLMLLVEENNNIKTFKNKIEKEKEKVLNDMDIFKKEIVHII